MTFDELYVAQYAAMVRLAHALVDTRPRAERLVEDAFAVVYERFDHIADPVAYVRVSVLNNCRRSLRRQRLLRRPFVDEYNLVVDAIRRLPHRARSMVALRYDLHLSDAEIADTLGIPINTVKSTMTRTLETLQKEIH